MKSKKAVLITGGCGFVGRNLIRKLSQESNIWIVDDLSLGIHPEKWIGKDYKKNSRKRNLIEYSNKSQRINFINADVIDVFRKNAEEELPNFYKIFHLASIVGGRELIEGDPILVGKDLAIDSVFFYWLTRKNRNVESVLYASSSAAYPVVLQGKRKSKALKEDFIKFDESLGVPDMTYGWSKLTGEYLSQITAKKYNIPIACVRPFSGYGEDQDFSYPIPAITKRIAMREDPIKVWGNGKQGRDFVHIDDCIDAFFKIMKKINDGTAVNIGSGKLTTFLEVINLLSKIEGYNPRVQPILNKPVGVTNRYADTKKVIEIGWKPKISNEEGFLRVLNYIKENRI